MKERKILTILGARPQFVKAAVVSRAIGAIPSLREVIVHTGQHYHEKMSEVFFNEMGIPRPQHMLAVGSGSHGAQTGRMLEAIEHVLVSEMPDWVLIYGDTNSTLAGALAAAKLRLPIAHVEAGLRSFNRDMPEEINRVVADHVSDLLLTPTAVASQQLRQEGIASSKIHEVGDVMLDSVLHYRERARISSRILANLKVEERGFVLATIHRPSNTDDLQVLRQLLDVLTSR
ncbi:UDP-N-acetyl glucosamine 2-epimerase, partial [bacterium]|nr:UDP-N-acetyl glucosamine 2-epimerase [bacterium]